jgi:hypothetical protein
MGGKCRENSRKRDQNFRGKGGMARRGRWIGGAVVAWLGEWRRRGNGKGWQRERQGMAEGAAWGEGNKKGPLWKQKAV